MHFGILYINFLRGNLQFIEIWSSLCFDLPYQCAFKFLRHELNIEQSHSFK